MTPCRFAAGAPFTLGGTEAAPAAEALILWCTHTPRLPVQGPRPRRGLEIAPARSVHEHPGRGVRAIGGRRRNDASYTMGIEPNCSLLRDGHMLHPPAAARLRVGACPRRRRLPGRPSRSPICPRRRPADACRVNCSVLLPAPRGSVGSLLGGAGASILSSTQAPRRRFHRDRAGTDRTGPRAVPGALADRPVLRNILSDVVRCADQWEQGSPQREAPRRCDRRSTGRSWGS